MEAIREGLEDYGYLALMKMILDSSATQLEEIDRQKAVRILNSDVQKLILDMPKTTNLFLDSSLDRLTADSLRIEVLRLLDKIGRSNTPP